ncbi:MAG: hypothetical protein COB15_06125 [Flavobacteriales bacterium]|nr:MAG: hypothetical protein COB15_06125 [Flavobacteriales bacterium]
MKKTNLLRNLTVIFTLLFTANFAFAQPCPTGQVEVTIDVGTDNWGSEIYWELVPTGNNCGTGTIFTGGNASVGCNGGGNQNNPAGGYANNQTYNEGPWCLTDGACYDIIFVDDYGDGGADFDVKVNGFSINTFVGAGSGSTFTFCATQPSAFDAGVTSISSPALFDDMGLKDVKGKLFNYGLTTITSLDINYQVDNGSTQTSNLTGLSIANGQADNFTHPIQWNATLGSHTIKVWTSNINGNIDGDASNDTTTKAFEVGPSIPNIISSYIGVTPVITQIGNVSDQLDKPTDLDFHPALARKELWVINQRLEGNGGSVVIYDDAGEPGQTDQQKVDGNAWHFMSLPSGIAFSKNGNFANSPGVYDANHNGGAPFTGPSLWSSDLSIFAQNFGPGTNGSHLDMLHESPYARGIANEEDNVFWVFDGNSSDLVRYDFVEDHGPGNSYHGDAIIHRYSDNSVAKDPNNKVVSHMVVHDGWVYSTDYGNNRVFRIQLNSGTLGSNIIGYESIAEHAIITGYTQENVVTTGLVEPAGIDIVDDRMIVSDYSTGDVIIYDITSMPATELGRIATGASGIMGIKIGPNGKIWYVDYDANTVNRIEGTTVGVDNVELENTLSIYPNPAKDNFSINLKGALVNDINVNVYDVTGKLVYTTLMKNNTTLVNTKEWTNGIYQVHMSNDTHSSTQKVVVQH